jgi:hypothetical protein
MEAATAGSGRQIFVGTPYWFASERTSPRRGNGVKAPPGGFGPGAASGSGSWPRKRLKK